tara:strand:+ start:83 stop:409 length:327 start_codon:yes stop_codon:yes gene_type:complete
MTLNFWRTIFCFSLGIVSYGLFSEPSSETSLSFPDYLLHFSSFFLLSFFLTKASNIFLAFVLIGLYAPITEIIQFFLPYRNASLSDLFFDYLGIFFSFFYLKIIEKSL